MCLCTLSRQSLSAFLSVKEPMDSAKSSSSLFTTYSCRPHRSTCRTRSKNRLDQKRQEHIRTGFPPTVLMTVFMTGSMFLNTPIPQTDRLIKQTDFSPYLSEVLTTSSPPLSLLLLMVGVWCLSLLLLHLLGSPGPRLLLHQLCFRQSPALPARGLTAARSGCLYSGSQGSRSLA